MVISIVPARKIAAYYYNDNYNDFVYESSKIWINKLDTMEYNLIK